MSGMIVNVAAQLYRLQTVDLKAMQRRARLKEIEGILGQDESVAKAQRDFTAAEAALMPWQTRARDLDLEIKGVTQKSQQADRTLYSGKVSNPKELQDLQEEIAALQRRQAQLEDELLEAMMNVEEEQKNVTTAQVVLKKAQAAWAGSQVDLLDEKQRLEAELVELHTARGQMTAAIDAASLAKYDALRPKKRGQAIALLQGDSCTACGVEQTSRLVQQVRHGGQLVTCESCGRILAAL